MRNIFESSSDIGFLRNSLVLSTHILIRKYIKNRSKDLSLFSFLFHGHVQSIISIESSLVHGKSSNIFLLMSNKTAFQKDAYRPLRKPPPDVSTEGVYFLGVYLQRVVPFRGGFTWHTHSHPSWIGPRTHPSREGTWDQAYTPSPNHGHNDRQTPVKTLSSRNFVGRR